MRKRFLGIICLLYSGIIGYVWFSDKLKNYLAPQMQIYIKCAFFVLIIVGIVLCLNKESNYKFKISDLILVLPLVMIILAGDGRLTASLVNNRVTNLKNSSKRVINKNKKKKAATQEVFGPPKPANIKVVDHSNENELEKEYDMSEIDLKIVDQNYYDIANYMNNIEDVEEFDGKTIKLKGFIVRYASFIPFGHFAIGKYGIGCCTADASFVGYIARLDESITTVLKNNEWYEIEGVLEPGEDNDGFDIMVIHVIKLKKISSKDEEQYVYPCQSYGNGKCKEVKKYGIEV